MPVEPNNGKFFVDLDGPEAVELLVETARALDPAKIAQGVPSHLRVAQDIADHLMFLSIVNREWFSPFRDEAVAKLHDRLILEIETAAVLLEGTTSAATDTVLERLSEDPTSWTDLTLVAGIGSETALSGLAEHTRQHPDAMEWVNRLGIHVGETGPAIRRFTPHRYSLHRLTSKGANGGFVGLPVDQVSHQPSAITRHYLSFDPGLVSGLPDWPHDLLHIVSPRTYWFTLTARVAPDGRYVDPIVDNQGESYDTHMLEIEADAPIGFEIEVRPYDRDLIVRNLHIQMTPRVLGTAGGPPIGLYPNPVCDHCSVLMFHGATTDTSVQDYGDGFRSVFYCSDCARVAVTGTNWN